jgi:hypothetical protein
MSNVRRPRASIDHIALTNIAKLPNLLARASLIAYLSSLCLPAYYVGSGGAFPGIFALVRGPIDLLALHVPWLANPLLFLSWWQLFKGTPVKAIAFSFLAIAAALVFWLGENRVQIATGSSASTYFVRSGYFVWFASVTVQFVASALAFRLNRNSNI